MNSNELKKTAKYISDTFSPAVHLHCYAEAEKAERKDDDFREFFGDRKDTLEKYFESRRKAETEISGNTRTFFSIDFDGTAHSYGKNDKLHLDTLVRLTGKYGFLAEGFSESLTERIDKIMDMINQEKRNKDFIFVNIHGLYDYIDGRKVISPKSMRLYTVKKSEESGSIYRVVYDGSEKLSLVETAAERYILTDAETGEVSEIDALCAEVTSDAFVTTESVNNGTAFTNFYRSIYCEDLLDSIHDLTVRKCRECEKVFAMTEREVNWYHEKGLKVPVRCKECRNRRKITMNQ